jgi:hypothetical protein
VTWSLDNRIMPSVEVSTCRICLPWALQYALACSTAVFFTLAHETNSELRLPRADTARCPCCVEVTSEVVAHPASAAEQSIVSINRILTNQNRKSLLIKTFEIAERLSPHSVCYSMALVIAAYLRTRLTA